MSEENNLITVTVKWNKKVLPPVQIDTSEPPTVFKSQLWTLTGVPPERQTIIGFKGGTKLKGDEEWSRLNPRPGMKLMLLGTPDESRVAPPPEVSTVHDDLDLDSSNREYESPQYGPPGLVNLGNTCYMNATMQYLRAASPLTSALANFRGSTNALNPAEKLSASLRDTFSRLKSANSSSVNPASFLATLRQVNSQFAERGQNGFFMQQDAEECLGVLLTHLSSTLSTSGSSENFVDSLFAFTMQSEDRCTETNEVAKRGENVRMLKCHIVQGVGHLHQGVMEGLCETIEKTSDQLGRSAKWNRMSRMRTIPPFLIVQFVRFFWKPTESVKAKILRKVSFPMTLDVIEFCTEELKDKLSSHRNRLPSGIHTELSPEGDLSSNRESEVVPADSGLYELCAVLTHKGRAADSGHYVAWVKDQDKKWFQFDDDKVSVHTEEDLKKLSGGGDWHMAYMLLYKATNSL